MTTITTIRVATRADEEGIWQIFREVIGPGDTYVFSPETTRAEALGWWFAPGAHPYVALDEGLIVGAYVLRPNQPGLGAHVANGAYMVSPDARGQGVGRMLGEHSIAEARRLGFRAMQFNAVVSTNEPAVKLWKKIGFRIVATLPGAFRHSKHGFVDLYVMFRELEGRVAS
jgi:L-amino acid N-acyltransferase YncA